jgi:hypothetical protein
MSAIIEILDRRLVRMETFAEIAKAQRDAPRKLSRGED